MWSENSTTHDLGRNCCQCTCGHASLYASKPMTQTQWYNNVLPNSTDLLTHQEAPQNPISGYSHVNNPLFHPQNDQEGSQQMATKYNHEIDSWFLLNSDHGENQNNLLTSYSPWTENQYWGRSNQQLTHNGSYSMLPFQPSREGLADQQHEQIFKFYQGIQLDFSRATFNHAPASFLIASVPPTGAGIVPESTIGSVSNRLSLPAEWELNQFSLPLVDPGHRIEASHSNSNSISSEGTQLLSSRAASKKPSKFLPMSRQGKVLRYLEKKKARKYEKKIQYSSRKTYAQTRPRIRGRFARSSQMDVQ